MPFGIEAVPLWVMARGIELMTWAAVQVSSLPGASIRVPAFSAFAFSLMVFGGLWLCLWQRRWRLLGLFPIALGICIAPYRTEPDVLIGREGRLLAVRGPDGRYAVLSRGSAKYELSRWLAHDGDNRTPAEARRTRGFRCDRSGCTYRHPTRLIALSYQPQSLPDDCQRSGLLILRYPKPAACQPDGMVIDYWQLRDNGIYALHFGPDAKVTVTHVEGARGVRPWTRQRKRRSANRQNRRRIGGRLAAFAARQQLNARAETQIRPEIESVNPDHRED